MVANKPLGEFSPGIAESHVGGTVSNLAAIVGTVFAVAIAVPSAHAADAQVGAKLYQQNCAKCHGPNGKGDGAELARLHATVTPNDWTDKESNAEMPGKAIISTVTKGGQANGKSKLMPSFRGKLDDAQIQDLIAYIRTLPK